MTRHLYQGLPDGRRPLPGADTLFKLAGVIVGVAGAISEESVFRGYLISELERTHKSPFVQIVVSGVAFGVIHIGFDWIA